MRNWLLSIFTILLAGNVTNVHALQIKHVIDNEITAARISAGDITRIFVQGDRIKSVRGLKGAYTRENDERNGEIYIQPSDYYRDHAFTILIETEQGKHFTLLLTPTSSPSETLQLVPKWVAQRAVRFETTSSYELTINHLMQAMKRRVLPPGYIERAVDNQSAFQFGNQIVVNQKSIYQGFNLQGELYEITNVQAKPLTLKEHEFYRKGTRAVSLDKQQLRPHEKTNLYRVIAND